MVMTTKSGRERLLPNVLIILGVVVAAAASTAVWVSRSVGEVRIRNVSLPKPVSIANPISEDQAMELAKIALKKTWPEVPRWKPLDDIRANGGYFVRETDSPNSGQVTFDTDPRAWSATVRINVERDSVQCSVVRHK